MNRYFDTLLAYHCSPALAGIKPANLVAFSVAKTPNYRELIALYNSAFNGKGIFFEMLRVCESRGLLLAFREEKLRAHLTDARCRKLLTAAGYPDSDDLTVLLDRMKARISDDAEFPHEIGVFLGYPPEDISGFLEKRGRQSLYAGYWKVYGNVEEKKELFHRYDRCRDAIVRRLDAGFSITELFACKRVHRFRTVQIRLNPGKDSDIPDLSRMVE
jgi:hypothetical protein